MRRFLGFVFLLLFTGIKIYAQKAFLRHYTTNEGLPSDKIYACVQDHRGFMWFGTDNGVVRFDGKRFEKFSVKEGLPDNDAFYIFEDREFRLWIITWKQAPCFFYNDVLHTVHNDTLLNRYFNQLSEFRFDVNAHTKRIIFYFVKPPKPDSKVIKEEITLLEYPNFKDIPMRALDVPSINFQLLTLNGVDFLYTFSHYINLSTMQRKTIKKTRNATQIIQIKRNGKDYGFCYNSIEKNHWLVQQSGDTLKVTRRINNDFHTGPFSNDYNFFYWQNSKGDIYKWQGDDSAIDLNVNLLNERVSHMYTDKTGNLWISTLENGLYMKPNSGGVLFDTKGLVPTCFAISNDSIFIGTENLNLLLYHKGQLNKIPINTYDQRATRTLAMVVLNHKLFFGGDYYLGAMDLKTGHKETFAYDDLFNSIKDLETWGYDKLLIATAHGAGIYNVKTRKIDAIYWRTRSTAINISQNGIVWIGTINGVYKITKNKTVPEKWVSRSKLDSARITDIKVDAKNRLWIGTSQYGVFVIEGEKTLNITQSLNTGKSLSSYNVKSILVTPGNEVWVSTDNGINRIDLQPNGQYRIYKINSTSGFQSNIVNACLVYSDSIFVASARGLARFPLNLSYLSEIPDLEITHLWVNLKEKNSLENLKFSPSENNISIEYAAISLKNADNIQYRYRVLGLDSQWVYTTNTKVDFLGLTAGQFTFQVQAINMLTGEASGIQQLRFTILKPWYKQFWFYLLLFLSIALMLFLFIKRRIAFVKRQGEFKAGIEKQMAGLEMQALRAQMNPHFIFNALTAIQNYFIQHKTEEANAYMARFARLIRQLLENSRNNFTPLDEELDLLTNYMELEEMRFEDKFEFRIQIQADIVTAQFQLPSMLLQPLLENSVNHGMRALKNKGLIELIIEKTDTHLLCIVQDNGLGIHHSEEQNAKNKMHKSRGMELLNSRINTLNKMNDIFIELTIEDLSEKHAGRTGTRTEIKIPLVFTKDKMRIYE